VTFVVWNLVSIHLETADLSVQNGSIICAKHTISTEIIFDAPMVLLGDEAQVDARFGLFGDSANLDARLVHGLRRTYYGVGNHFGRARWYS
jgi:hypothetical protein